MSKILANSHTPKALYVPNVNFVEQVSMMIKEYCELLKPIGYEPAAELQDLEFVLNLTVKMKPSRDKNYALLETKQGRAYMMGFIAAIHATELIKDEQK